MKKTILALMLSATLAAPAFAGDCPNLMGQVDEAMKTTTVDEATKTEIMALYETGKAAHEAGDHATSMTSFNAALELLKV